MKTKLITLSILTLLLATLAHAVFILPSEITVAGRQDEDGTRQTDVLQDGVNSAASQPPVITLTGNPSINVAQGGTYSEQGATCTDVDDGTIIVPAPTFSPALNTAVIGTYTATYTCTDTDTLTDTVQRIVSVGTTSYAGFGPQSSTKAQEWGFDFVEEFDGLQDWNQSTLGRVGNTWDSTRPTAMPRLADGSPSAWGYYSMWGSGTVSTHSWIGGTEGGTRQVWRGTKSASIDIGETAKGPSRMGLYMGPPGYSHWSFFYMTYIPKNSFPTFCAAPGCSSNGVGEYTEGDPYTYWAAYKYNTFNTGCYSSRCPESNTYGVLTNLTNIKYENYTPTGVFFQQIRGTGTNVVIGARAGTNLNNRFGNWFGLEVEVETISASQYRMNMWVYSADGTGEQVLVNAVIDIPSTAQGHLWDQFFFGGNNSGSWTWGPTMVSHYYVDDFIVDSGSKGRIGPRYFNAINN